MIQLPTPILRAIVVAAGLALFSVAVPVMARADEAHNHTMAEFQGMYNSTVAEAQKLGQKINRTCWNATKNSPAYCQNVMTFSEKGWMWSAYNILKPAELPHDDGRAAQSKPPAPELHSAERPGPEQSKSPAGRVLIDPDRSRA